MRRFSERLGLIKPRNAIQKDDIDDRLRGRLWTAVRKNFFQGMHPFRHKDEYTDYVLDTLQDEFFGEPIDRLSRETHNNIDLVRNWAFKANWNEFYDLIQFFGDYFRKEHHGHARLRITAERFMRAANLVLEVEKSAYRFVDGELVPISDEIEIVSLEQAVENADSFRGARQHMRQALRMYADRSAPDYRNSIKEAISAIESAFSTLNEKKSKNLSSALNLAEKKGLQLHPALSGAISQLYGWTSDEGGIRHAFSDEPNEVEEPQARMMLVLCSALLNFLVSSTSGNLK